METILIKNIYAVGQNKICDILIEDGKIKRIADSIESDGKVIDGTGLTAFPSFFDMHVHFRDPGQTHKEDILTGADSAIHGGFTGVACMPNTNPVVDSPETVKYILDKAKPTGIKVYPIVTVTKGMEGKILCDYEELKKAGAIAISEDGKPVKNAEIMRQALEKSNENGMLIISHCEDLDIINKGIINKGEISRKLNVPGMDRASEDSITAREIALAYSQDARIHIAHVSTEGSMALVRDAKRRGVKVTCETAPHYFLLTQEKLLSRDADYRMNPPLREEKDRLAVIDAIADGTVDCIVTDHAPHAKNEKEVFEKAPNGIVGLETSFAGVTTGLYHTGRITLERIAQLMSENPRKILGLPVEKIAENADANITITDLNEEWTVDPEKLHSKSKNTAFKGMKLKGKVKALISDGKLLFDEIN